MSEVKIRLIEKLTGIEVDKLVTLLCKAFASNVPIPAMTGGNEELEDSLFRAMVRAGGHAGRLYVIENEKRQILSMALWYGPGATLFSTEEERKLGFNDFISKLDDTTRDWWNTTYPQEIGNFISSWLPISLDDSWYLNLIGTDPEHQRKGYASLLLSHAIQNVESHNVLAFCSTNEENASFYANAGFPIRGNKEIPAREYTFPIFGHSREV